MNSSNYNTPKGVKMSYPRRDQITSRAWLHQQQSRVELKYHNGVHGAIFHPSAVFVPENDILRAANLIHQARSQMDFPIVRPVDPIPSDIDNSCDTVILEDSSSNNSSEDLFASLNNTSRAYDYSTNFACNQDCAMLEKQLSIPRGYVSNYINISSSDEDVEIIDENQLTPPTDSAHISAECLSNSTRNEAIYQKMDVSSSNSQWIPNSLRSPVLLSHYDSQLWNSPASSTENSTVCTCGDPRPVSQIHAQWICIKHS